MLLIRNRNDIENIRIKTRELKKLTHSHTYEQVYVYEN